MSRLLRMLGCALVCAGGFAAAQTTNSKPMTLDEFRHYIDVLHIKDSDERGVRASMKAEAAQFPPWWPASVNDAMISSMLQIDIAAIDYEYVKTCASSEDLAALTMMFATPDGQAYVNTMTGDMVSQEAKGMKADAARDAAMDHDTGLPAGALAKLSSSELSRVKTMVAGGAMDCMNSGYKKAGVDISDARTKAARAVVAEHRDELIAAKSKFEAAQAAPRK